MYYASPSATGQPELSGRMNIIMENDSMKANLCLIYLHLKKKCTKMQLAPSRYIVL